VLEQLDLLGEVVPVLRRELDAKRPDSVPDGPTHEALVAASVAEAASRETSPGETSPGETSPDETSPGESSPDETSPGESSPDETSAVASRR